MNTLKLLAVTVLLSAPALAQSPPWHRPHRLRFDPAAISLRTGQSARVHLDDAWGRQVDPRTAALSNPEHNLAIRVLGHEIEITALSAGRATLIAEQRSGWNREVAQMVVDIAGRAGPDLFRIALVDAQMGQPFGNRPIELAPGQRLDLRAIGYCRAGNPLEIDPHFDLSSPAAGLLRQRGDRAVLIAGQTACPVTIHELRVHDGRVADVLRFRIVEAQRGPARIELVQRDAWGRAIPVGAAVYARRGSVLSLEAVATDRFGREVRFDERWSLSSAALGQLHRQGHGRVTLHLDPFRRGTLIVEVRDGATGLSQHVQVIVH